MGHDQIIVGGPSKAYIFFCKVDEVTFFWIGVMVGLFTIFLKKNDSEEKKKKKKKKEFGKCELNWRREF